MAKDKDQIKDKAKYKIDFIKANKIEITHIKCGNCGMFDSNIFTCKYNITEFDEFLGEQVEKTKSTKVCGKCKWYLEKYIIPSKVK